MNRLVRILATDDPYEAKRIGQEINTLEEWQQDKEKIMMTVLTAKAEQCERYHNFLIDSKERPLHEDTPNKYWGGRPGGRDRLGILHMRIREEIKAGNITLKGKKGQKQNENRRFQSQKGSRQHGHNTPQRQRKRAPYKVTIMGDSNLRRLDPDQMTRYCQFDIISAKTTEEALRASSQITTDTDVVVIHTGTNDLKQHGPEITADNISKVVNNMLSKGTKVVISQLLPRSEYNLNTSVIKVNEILQHRYNKHKQVQLTNVDRFYYFDTNMPNRRMYNPESNGSQTRLLHVSDLGLAELSRQIQWGVRQLTSQ